MAIEQGTSGAIEQAESYSFTPFEQTLTETWVGNHAAVQALVSTYQGLGYSGSVTPLQGPKSSITASKIIAGSLETRWGLDTQFAIVDALDSRKFHIYLDGLPSDTARAASQARIQLAASQLAEGVTTEHDALASTDEKAWARDAGFNKGYPEVSAVLTRKNMYPVDTAYVTDWADIGKVWTTAQIDALTSAPSAIVGTLPSGRVWLMTPGGIDDDSQGRYIVTTHWVYGRYPSHAFDYK
jgi:hypothetical protein